MGAYRVPAGTTGAGVTWIAGYALTGALIGFLAGMLGIGGGMTLVPILAAMFTAQGLIPEHNVHLALGTCMASIMFTAAAGVREHQRHGVVDWSVARRMVPGMVVGTLASTAAAGFLPQRALALAFALIDTAGTQAPGLPQLARRRSVVRRGCDHWGHFRPGIGGRGFPQHAVHDVLWSTCTHCHRNGGGDQHTDRPGRHPGLHR